VFLAEVLDLLALHDFDAAVTSGESVPVFGDQDVVMSMPLVACLSSMTPASAQCR
jgi:hypothetical protein